MLQFIQQQLRLAPVVVFSKLSCPYCLRAKSLLNSLGVNQKNLLVIELDQRPDGAAIQDQLKELTGARSVPRVFINGKFVGGCDDIHELDARGELVKKLKEAKAL
eukprot:TRINITY_DN2860_c0_g1_i1.p1 TRINITY_DN2860_c0_g1~~TRINITY_DN2860_c0_g1_i1.p1  ORF type:complete len:105 (-),score=26.31 TRINITY_DN2860_c0_g1_i1:255-569(-)